MISRTFFVHFCYLVLAGLALNANALWADDKPLSAPDVDNLTVPINPPGRVTLVLYANPDMEEDLRQAMKSIEPLRGRSDFYFVRVVDFRGGVPPAARGAVREQIRKELDKENTNLRAKEGIKAMTHETDPIIPDFNGSVLDDLHWPNIVEAVQYVVFNRQGKEIKRGTDAKGLKEAVSDAL